MELPGGPEASIAERQQLTSVRNALLRLHKILLDAERVRYERANGRVDDMFQLLNLTINDPAFAWLRPLSAMIVQIDERMEDKELVLTSADSKALRDEVRVLLTPAVSGNDFQRNYHWALQETPEAIIGHSEVVKSLSA